MKRRDQDARTVIAGLQRAIDEGLASGISEASLDDIFVEARRRAEALRDQNGPNRQ